MFLSIHLRIKRKVVGSISERLVILDTFSNYNKYYKDKYLKEIM